MSSTEISAWSGDSGIDSLAELLHAAVHAGASVGFVVPFSMDEAREFWARVRTDGLRRVLVARSEGHIVGTVQLNLDMAPNQGHRAEIVKLLVHPKARRQGIARSLMQAIEDLAREEGRTLLTLDTRTGDAAERLYVSMGYKLAGVIPGYARGPHRADLEATSIFYKELSGDNA